jgi:hypothetical protein
MVKCKDIKELLPSYLDDFLEPEKKKIIEEHLCSCSQCSKELADLKKAMQMLQEIEEVDTPPWFKQQIMARVRQEAAEKKEGFFKRLFYPLHVKIPVQALAMVLVAVIALYLYKAAGPEATRMGPVNIPAKISNEPAVPGEGNSLYAKGPGEKEAGSLSGKAVPGKQTQQSEATSNITAGKTGKHGQCKTEDSGFVRPRLPQEKSQQPTAATSAVVPQVADKALMPVVTLNPKDALSASKEIEGLLTNAGTRIIERQYSDIKETITIEIEQDKLNTLIKRLQTLGVVEIKDMPAGPSKDKITLRLDIVGKKD